MSPVCFTAYCWAAAGAPETAVMKTRTAARKSGFFIRSAPSNQEGRSLSLPESADTPVVKLHRVGQRAHQRDLEVVLAVERLVAQIELPVPRVGLFHGASRAAAAPPCLVV